MSQSHCDFEYAKDEDLFKKIQTPKVCVSCLNQNVAFVKLSNCKHAKIFEYFLNIKVEFTELLVCTLCHLLLKKIELFREQTENNLAFLNEQCNNLVPSSKQHLQVSSVHTTDSSVPIKEDVEDFYIDDFITEVKVEHDSDVDVPLSEIKKEISGKKSKKKEEKKRKTKIEVKYDGKVRVVHLSEEEMWSERERDMNKPAFLKLPYRCDDCITGFDHELNLKDHMEKRHGEKKNNLVCKICKSVLGSEHSFKEHVKRHYKRYECCGCGKRNNTVYSVVTHYKEQHGAIDANYTCRDCGFTTASHRSYRYHRDKHRPKQQCALCPSTFVNAAGLRVHMYTVHKQSARVFSCDSCRKVYSSSSGLLAHAAAAHAHRPAYCAPCNKHFNTETNLTTVHKQSARVFSCDSCHKVYSSRSGLLAHAAAAHAHRPAYCAPCNKHFNTETNLTHHLNTHSAHVGDSNKVTCNECGGRFRTKTALLEHIDFVHLKKDKYPCGRCSKSFMNKAALKKHTDFVHEKIRPPRNKICDHCGRGFTTMSILRSHVRTHTGERPLRCTRCPAAFAHSAALYTHNKLIHQAHDN